MTTWIRSHPERLALGNSLSGKDGRGNPAGCVSPTRHSNREDRLISSLNSITTALAGLALGMSVVTIILRLAQRADGLLW